MNDMYNENDVNTAFLNNAIGRLFNKEDYNIEKNRALISNMDDTKKELLKETISNAVKKYEYKVLTFIFSPIALRHPRLDAACFKLNLLVSFFLNQMPLRFSCSCLKGMGNLNIRRTCMPARTSYPE